MPTIIVIITAINSNKDLIGLLAGVLLLANGVAGLLRWLKNRG